MTILSQVILRILPVAFLAVGCETGPYRPILTSYVSLSPFEGETGVAASSKPSVTFHVEEQAPRPAARWLSLRHADGQPVAGQVEASALENSLMTLRFVPDAPLPEDDYELVVDHGGDVVYGVDGVQVTKNVFAFTTVSRPEIIGAFGTTGETGRANLLFSQAIDEASFAEHAFGLYGTDEQRPVLAVTRLAVDGYAYEISLEPGSLDVWLTDGILAADGTPLPDLPNLLSVLLQPGTP